MVDCFGCVFRSACLEELLGDGFARRCAVYLEVSCVRIELSLIFWGIVNIFNIMSAL